MSRLTRSGTAETVSRGQILRGERRQGSIHLPYSAHHEQDWQPYPVDPYSTICDDHTYIHTWIGTGTGTGTEARTAAEMGTGTTITGTRRGLGRAEGRRKSTRNRKIAEDAARETGETWVESEKNVEKKGLVQ